MAKRLISTISFVLFSSLFQLLAAGEYRYSPNGDSRIISGTSDGVQYDLKSDELTRAIVVIDPEHADVHEGCHYNITGSTSVTNGQILEFIFKTANNTAWPHITWDYSGNTSAFTVISYEGVTVSTENATAITPQNNNRNSTNTSSTLVWKSTGTGVTSSTILTGPFTIGSSGNPQSRVGSSQDRGQERILKQNTWYIWRFTNGADTQVINYRVNWYEE